MREYCYVPESDHTTEIKIGGTTYEVCTHWNPDGKQTLLEQLMKLILQTNMDSLESDDPAA